MHKLVRVAVIGKGRWGANIIRTLESLPGVVISHIETREYTTLLQKSDIDAVIVATPATTHTKIALSFITKGVPTFIEKPMTTSVAEAKRIVAAAKKYKTPVFVGHIHLYSPAYKEAKKLSKTLGSLRLLAGEGMNNGPVRSDTSATWDWAPHDVSMMLDIVGAMPLSVQAWGSALLRPGTAHYDTVHVRLLFPKGIVGLIHSSWLSPQKRKRLTVVGTKSSLTYNDAATTQKVTLYKNMGPNVTKKGRVVSVATQESEISYPPYAEEMPLTAEMSAFIDTVRTGKRPATDADSGLAVVAVLEAAEKSIAKNGALVKVKK